MVQIAGHEDTRAQARAWVEAEVPEGTAIGNFGGWAGDVQVQTFENLWWQMPQFEQAFGREQFDKAVGFLARQPRAAPFYSYGIQRTNIQAAPGSMEEIERLEPGYLILHRHPLAYSRIDSGFASSLKLIAERVAFFSPLGLGQSTPLYDPLDAFYVPMGRFGALEQPGPEVEIWRAQGAKPPPKERLSAKEIFARGYATGAAVKVARGGEQEAAALANRALELDPQCAEAYFVLGFLAQRGGRTEETLAFYRRQLSLQPASAGTYHNLAALYHSLHQPDQVEQMLREALRLAPWKRFSYAALAKFYQGQSQPEQVLKIYTQQLERFPDQGFAHEELGVFFEKRGQLDRAAEVYRRGLARDARYGPCYLRLAQLHLGAGHPQQAAEIGEAWLQLDPGRAEAHRLLAYVCRSLGQTGKARTHAQEAMRLAPGADPELERWLAGQ
jgi:tetratricopeptide (TPR) repeat protein